MIKTVSDALIKYNTQHGIQGPLSLDVVMVTLVQQFVVNVIGQHHTGEEVSGMIGQV